MNICKLPSISCLFTKKSNLFTFFTAQIVEVSDTPLRRVIKDLGGWPVTDPTWDPDHAPQLELMMAVIKRNFTLGVLVEEWVGPDDRNSQKHIIQIGKRTFK